VKLARTEVIFAHIPIDGVGLAQIRVADNRAATSPIIEGFILFILIFSFGWVFKFFPKAGLAGFQPAQERFHGRYTSHRRVGKWVAMEKNSPENFPCKKRSPISTSCAPFKRGNPQVFRWKLN
jgi:hypothetical protein